MARSVYLAHIAGDGRVQTVAEHLEGTARRSAAFAADFGSEDFGRLVGLAHDIGKNTSAFQRRLKENGPKVDHSTAGAIECAGVGAYMSACCVIGHHGGLPDFGNPEVDMPGTPTFSGRLKKGMQGGIPPYERSGPLPAVPPEPDFQDDGYRLAMWTRMLYSCLVDADYLDTEEFMSGGMVPRGGCDALPVLWDRLKRHIEGFYPPKGALNRLRCRILEDCTEAGSGQKGIYTLTVPTGGGKTLASLAFALRHAIQHSMRRIIYVIPYTSIIEQNALVFRSILGENNVLEHHSGAIFDSDEETNGEKSRQRLASENWDAPVVVTTAVQFFESIHANRSSNPCIKEVAQEVLNRNCDDQPYLLGRLFAVLEKIQLASADWGINRSIKDSYFTSITTTPAIILEKLLQLSEHHMKKLIREKRGYALKLEKEKSSILCKMTMPVASRFTPEEATSFYLGYYHQMNYKEDTEA